MKQLLRKYKDKLNRLVSVHKDTITKKYELAVMDSYTFLTRSIEFPNRDSCMDELKRYPKKTLKSH